jgi:glutathione S-transferase
MKLYITPASPYARMARIVVIEKGLESRVEIVTAQTRLTDSPYYKVNPSGRVPYLIRDDSVGLEESALICAYLDYLDGKPRFDVPAGEQVWEVRRLEAMARSMLDGLTVWGREITRPKNEQSPTIIRHETDRSKRMADLWERQIDHPLMREALNMPQLTLACALGFEPRLPDFQWRTGHPKLCDWFAPFAARPSFTATVPPNYR